MTSPSIDIKSIDNVIPVPETRAEHAMLVVCGYAKNTNDAIYILTMLGLIEKGDQS